MKSLKNLLIPFIILLALIAVVVVVVVIKTNDNKEEEVQNYQLVLYKPEEVKKVVVERKEKDDLILFKDGDKWSFEGADPSMSFSEDSIKRFLAIVLDYNANTKVNATDVNLEDYGLADNYSYKINICANDGTTRTLTLGDDTNDGKNCYVTVDNMDGIYLIATMKKTVCDYNLIDFYSSLNIDLDYANVDKIIIDRKIDSYPITIVPEKTDSGYSFSITEPFIIDAGDNLNVLLTSIKDLEIAAFTDLDEAGKKEVGLDDPSYHLSFVMKNGQTKEIYLSEMKDEMYYGYGSVCDDCFMISAKQIENLTYPMKDLIGKYVYQTNISEVKEIVVNYGDLEFSMKINAEDSISSDDAEVFLDGRDAKIFNSSGRCYAAILFETLALIKIGDVDIDAVPSGTPVMTVKVFYKDYTNKTISFIQRDESSYYFMIDDEYTGFFVYSNELFKDGGTDTYSYGIIGAYDLLTTAINDNLNGIYDIPAGE